MVLSTTKRTSSISSIVSQNQGGGDRKAGLVPKSTTTAGLIAFNVRHYPQPMSNMMLPLSTPVRNIRGIGWRFGER
jgi:hypothetical protein